MKHRDKAFNTKMTKLTDLVDYQDGAVVSREIINQKSGSVTLFAFDEGQGLSEHMAPFDAMVYLLDGEAEITISGNSLYLKQGEMVIMPANQLHSLKATKRFKMVLTMIKPCGQELQQHGTEDKG
ncbi:MAG: cupin domain-containing protein [Dehalococcoidia bacterium]|nr:cupin domain-containing protein [Dehalococcoidia bacterium]